MFVASEYQIWLHDLLGRPALQLDPKFVSLDATRTANNGGSLVLIVPADVLVNANVPGLSPRTLVTDLAYWWIVAYRSIGNVRKLVLNTAWLVLKVEKYLDASGNRLYRLTCVDSLTAFLGPATRIIDYYSNASQGEKNEPADDMLKDIVRDNYVSATLTARNISSAYLSVAPNASLSTSIYKVMAWRDVLPVFQEIVQSLNKGLLGIPGQPTLGQIIGGTLTPADYTYAVTAYTAGETTASTQKTITLFVGNGTVVVSWSAVTGALGYKVYGRTGLGLLSDVGNVLLFSDTGALTPGVAPPGTNNAYLYQDSTNKLFFDMLVTSTNPLAFQFQTFTQQLGKDHSSTGDSAVQFSPDLGNLLNPNLTADYLNEVNAVTVGGQGDDSTRAIRRVFDTTRSVRSWISRREAFLGATDVDSTDVNQNAILDDEGNHAVGDGKPKITLTGDIVDTDVAAFGYNWDYGDKVIGVFDQDSYDCWINNVDVKMETGVETVTGKLSSAI